jgi:nitrite reductase/ring-hydroxylating ferredoxin subunit/uncharacterized membrane protein
LPPRAAHSFDPNTRSEKPATKSKASIKSHPIHPMLISFPIAFLTVALVCDLAGRIAGAAGVWTAGAYLSPAGIVTALVAAIPGLVDYFQTVPPKSTGKRRATLHLLSNSSAVALFAVAWVVRGEPAAMPSVLVLLLEEGGAALLAMGGWMGGTLVHRNFIGPEHRYAEAGSWREVRVEAKPGERVTVAAADELEVDQMKLVRVGGKRIVLARTEQGHMAFDDRCTHRGGSLAGGVLLCGKVQCLWHGSQFDASTGRVWGGPAEQPIATYRAEEQDGEIRLYL